mmetsp:Transcript_652/g.1556  ORF Transcript_652/g.1556 Transcript_652/m.1556 type:complete len:298 (-) Transcript_652:672-1565(-)
MPELRTQVDWKGGLFHHGNANPDALHPVDPGADPAGICQRDPPILWRMGHVDSGQPTRHLVYRRLPDLFLHWCRVWCHDGLRIALRQERSRCRELFDHCVRQLGLFDPERRLSVWGHGIHDGAGKQLSRLRRTVPPLWRLSRGTVNDSGWSPLDPLFFSKHDSTRVGQRFCPRRGRGLTRHRLAVRIRRFQANDRRHRLWDWVFRRPPLHDRCGAHLFGHDGFLRQLCRSVFGILQGPECRVDLRHETPGRQHRKSLEHCVCVFCHHLWEFPFCLARLVRGQGGNLLARNDFLGGHL